MIRALAVVLALVLAAPGAALEPGERMADPLLEARAREIGRSLRCLVCQNQSIDDSDADLARDLRAVVRERIATGASDREVVAYVRDRYGDFVLLKPPFKPTTYALWGAPAVILVLAIVAVAMVLRRRRTAAEVARLSAEEEARLARLLDEGRG